MKKSHVDIPGDDRAKVKREETTSGELPAALDLQQPEIVYSGGGAFP